MGDFPRPERAWSIQVLERWRERHSGYGFAIAVFLVAFLVRYSFNSWLGGYVPFITFFPALLIVTFFAGLRPGILVAVLSGAASWYFFLPPPFSFALDRAGILALIFFCLTAASIIVVMHTLHTALDELQIARKAANTEFAHFVRSVTDYGIYMLDPEGRVSTWNAGAERIHGYSTAESTGLHVSCFHTKEERASGAPAQALETAAREGRFETESLRVRKDSSKFYANVVIDAIRDPSGKLIGFAKITRDITERLKEQRALEATRNAFVQAQKMDALGQLTGGIAHDFNNLLQAISGGITVLRKQLPPLNDDSRDWLDLIKRNTDRAASLTQRLLAFSRRQPLNPRILNLNKLVAGLVQLLQQSLGESIAIETVLGSGMWLVNADANELETAILNLAINARDAMPQGGKLTVETANAFLDETYAAREELASGQYAMIAISDSGTGMSKETVQKAFEPFFTTKELGKGTGLGLSQVHGFIKQSNGHVKIYSELGQGTTVKIYLPRLIGEEVVEDSQDGRAVPAGSGAETILVVEDDADVGAFAARVLGDLGYRVLLERSPSAALAALEKENAVHLLLADVGLPDGMNGRQLADMVRQKWPSLRVLFMTGYARNAIIHHGRLDPGVELIVKPFSDAALAEKVRRVLDSKPMEAK